jgi:hypothetical protein
MAQVKVRGGSFVSFLHPETGVSLAESGMLFTGWYEVASVTPSEGNTRVVVKTDNKTRHADIPQGRIEGYQK